MMIVLYIVLGIILLVLLLALVVSKDMNYEQSIIINANIDKVWGLTSSMKGLDKWNPWNAKDPNMDKTFGGEEGKVGEYQSWLSNEKNVGEGKQTITNLEKPNLLETKLEFIKPFKSVADAYVTLAEENGFTKVSWGFKSTMPYPMNLMKLFINFEKNMDKDFGEGLHNLKKLCE